MQNEGTKPSPCQKKNKIMWLQIQIIYIKRYLECEIADFLIIYFFTERKYDDPCKRLFQNKEIIAPVLKKVIPEYKNATIEEF